MRRWKCSVIAVASFLFALVVASTASATITITASDYHQGSGITETVRTNIKNAEVYDDNFKDKPVGSGVNFVSLGLGGSLILSLNGGSIIDGAGDDFILRETTYFPNNGNWDSYKETAHVYAYNGQYVTNGNDWVSLGEARQDGYFNLGDVTTMWLGFTTAIKIIDISTQSGDGYDVDGLELIHTSTVPLPGAALLFGSGLLGLVGLRRREIV